MLDNTPNQPSKFTTKNWVEINDDSLGTHNTNSQVKFKTSMLKSSLCNYSDAYIHVTGTITVLQQPLPRAKIMVIKRLYLKIVVLLLVA